MSEHKHAKRMAILAGRVKPLQRTQIAEAYWLSDLSVRSIAEKYRSTARQIARLAGPAELAMPPCPVCGQRFVAEGREEAIRLLTLPVYPADAYQGLVPVCCGPWVTWYDPLSAGDHAKGEYGGGAIGEKWRHLNGR